MGGIAQCPCSFPCVDAAPRRWSTMLVSQRSQSRSFPLELQSRLPEAVKSHSHTRYTWIRASCSYSARLYYNRSQHITRLRIADHPSGLLDNRGSCRFVIAAYSLSCSRPYFVHVASQIQGLLHLIASQDGSTNLF